MVPRCGKAFKTRSPLSGAPAWYATLGTHTVEDWYLTFSVSNPRTKHFPRCARGRRTPIRWGSFHDEGPFFASSCRRSPFRDGSDGMPYLYAVNKSSGVRLGQIQLPAGGRYGMMTYMHQGRQHVLVQTRGGLVALDLPLPASR